MSERIRVSDLEKYGQDRDRFLSFLYELEQLGILRSSMKKRPIGSGMERVWEANEK